MARRCCRVSAKIRNEMFSIYLYIATEREKLLDDLCRPL